MAAANGRRILLWGAPVAALVMAGLLTVVQHVPAGHIGIADQGGVAAGWRLHAPFAPLRSVPSRGTITSDAIRWNTKEGSAIGFRLELDYDLGAGLAPQLAHDIRRVGLTSAVESLATRVVEDVGRRLDTEAMLSAPSVIETPLALALRSAGIGVGRLTLRSALGDEVLRRRKTDEAASATRQPVARVLCIGWDGADWEIAAPLIAAGRMPHLARLVREGAHGDLRSYDPMFSPLLWTTVATGKAPTEHGIADFLVKDAATGDRRPMTSDLRKVKALWNIFSDFDRPSTWIAWWASYPAESIRGMVVSDLLGSTVARKDPGEGAARPGIVYPAEALNGRRDLLIWPAKISRDELSRILPVSESEYRDALSKVAEPPKKGGGATEAEDPIAFVLRAMAVTRTYQAIALDALRRGMPFVAVYFEAVDMVGHRFQHFLPPRMSFVTDADFARFREVVPNWYAYQDALLGELLRAADPETVTMLLSDHGFRSGSDRPDFPPYTKGQPEEWHREWGILVLHGPGVVATVLPRSSIYDVAPTLLYLEGLPLAADMPGRLIDGALDPALVRRRPPAKIRSYELVGARSRSTPTAAVDAEAMAEMIANLQALGYVGGAPPRPTQSPGEIGSGPSGESAQTQFFFHRNLAVNFLNQGRLEDAERELLAANERMPRGKTFALLSRVRASRGRFRDAIAALEEGWSQLPDEMDPESLLWIVNLRLLDGDREGAAASVAKWSTRMPPAVRLASDGRIAESGGDRARAAQLYREAIEKDPLLVSAVQRLFDLDAGSGHPDALEPFLLKTLAAHPKVDAYWDLAGRMALARGDVTAAIDRFRRACDIDPDNGAYLGRLASSCAAAGRVADARQALAWADRFPPSDPDAWMAIGGALDRLGETDRAVAAFAKARSAGLEGPGSDLAAALALARAGRTSEARTVLADASRRFPESEAIRALEARIGVR